MAKRKTVRKKARTTRKKPPPTPPSPPYKVERTQTGVRMEKRLLKVLKALAEYYEISLGDLLEGIVLHAFDGKCAFTLESRERIDQLKRVFELDLDSRASHRMFEESAP